MGKDPQGRATSVHRLRLRRLASLPVPVLFVAMAVLWAADLPGSYESLHLLLVLNVVFSLLVSLFVAYLLARSFLARGTPGLLLLGCGVILWGLAGVVGPGVAHGDVNVSITIHNVCTWLSALCHLTGVLLSLRPRQPLSPAGIWLPAAYAHAVGTATLVTLSVRAGWLPTFFVQGEGGTPLRQFVLMSAIIMFALTAVLLTATSQRPLSAFAYWYALALTLIVTGLAGVTLQSFRAGILGWTARATQLLGCLYMLIAALASVRESRVWGISLRAALQEERDFSAAVLDTAGALVVVLDPEGRITRFNRACEQLTGYAAEEVLGRTCREFLIPPNEAAGVQAAWEATLAGSVPNRHENHWLARDGTRRLIDWSNTVLMGKAGEVRHVIAIGIDITERRRAEETLRETQALTQAVMDGSPDLIYMKDLEGRVLIANPAACAALGRSPPEVIGKTAREFHRDRPETARAIMENDRRIMRSGETETVEEVGGQGRTYLSTKAPYCDAGGKVVGLLGISRDITDRKQAEQRLKADLAALTRMHALSTQFLDADGLGPALQQIVNAAVTIMGAERGTLQLVEGDSLRLAAHYGHQPSFLKFFASVKTQASVCGEAKKRKQRVIVADVQHNPLFTGTASRKVLLDAGVRAVQSTPLLDCAGRLLGILTTQWGVPHIPDEHDLWRIDLLARQAADLIEHKQAQEQLRDANENLQAQAEQLQTLYDSLQIRQRELEAANEDLRAQEQELREQAEALRESEDRYRMLFETAPDAIVVCKDGRILDANEAALRLVGAGNAEELASHPVLDFFRPQEREQVADRMRLALMGRRLPIREGTLLRLDGREVTVEFHTGPIDIQGVPAVQTIMRDITERRRAEEALRELNATLEAKVAQRTAELERRTRQLQKLAAGLSLAEEHEQKRVAEILHGDLQQQIAGAKFQLNLLSHQAQGGPAQQLTATEIDEILKNAIRMSRSLSHELSPGVFYGNDLGEALEWLAGHVEAAHDVAIRVEVCDVGTLPSESLTVFLFRAARELLSNVVRHAGVREARIRLRRMGRHVGLRVSDRGRGFDPQKLKETAGFGLLGIRERVEWLGGRMKIRSAKDRGTTVRIVVPDTPENEHRPR